MVDTISDSIIHNRVDFNPTLATLTSLESVIVQANLAAMPVAWTRLVKITNRTVQVVLHAMGQTVRYP